MYERVFHQLVDSVSVRCHADVNRTTETMRFRVISVRIMLHHVLLRRMETKALALRYVGRGG